MKGQLCIVVVCIALLLAACQKANNYSNRTYEVVKEWKLTLLAANELHKVGTIADSASFHLELTTENSLRFDINIDSLQQAGEQLTGLVINAGNPVQDGTTVLDLRPRVISAYASGVIYNLRQSFMDSLVNDDVELYVNAITNRTPAGLLRQQLNDPTILTANVAMTGPNMVPAVSTNVTAVGYIRMTAAQKLYSSFQISNPESTDVVTSAALYAGEPGSNGNILLPLADNAVALAAPAMFSLSEIQFNTIRNTPTYIQISSGKYPGGKLRGQIK